MAQVKLFVNGNQMDLYDDETIQITSQLKDIRDISQVFSDFSQQFSIPASGRNNRTLNRAYDNTLLNPSYNPRNFINKQRAEIDIDGVIYKRGYIKYDKAVFKMGKISHHLITFTGAISGLSDIIKDYKIRDLDFSYYNHQSNTTNTRWGMDNTSSALFDNDIIYPLINSTSSGWTTTQLSGGTIDPSGLQPAMQIDVIMSGINTFYTSEQLNISFHDSFNSEYIYMYLGNQPEEDEERQNLTYSDVTVVDNPPNSDHWSRIINNETGVWDIGHDTAGYYYEMRWDIFIVPVNSGATWTLKLERAKKDSLEWEPTGIQKTHTGAAVFRLPVTAGTNEPILKHDLLRWTLITLTAGEEIEVIMDYSIRYGGTWIYILRAENGTFVTQQPVDEIMEFKLPQIKVMDWLTGVVNMFNLIPVNNEGDFKEIVLTPYNTWLLDGRKSIDITKLIDESSFSIKIPDIPKEIQFKYKEAKAENGAQFLQAIGRGYGDLINENAGGQGETFKIELPFENLLWEKLAGTDYLVGEAYTLDSGTFDHDVGIWVDLKPVNDVPFFMYWDPSGATQSIDFDGWSSPLAVYKLCNTFSSQSSGATSLNFTYDLDVFATSARTDVVTLYEEYSILMDNYLNPTSRVYEFEGVIPISVLSQIKLNDILQIHDRHYYINKIQVDTLTGKSKLELINYYRVAQDGIAPIDDNTPPQTCAIWVVEGEVPTQPENLEATSITTTGFTLCWSASTAPTGHTITSYNIFKDNVLYDSVSGATCINISGQTVGSTSYWSVTSEDDTGANSVQSEALSVTMDGPSVLTFTNPLSLVTTGETYLTISWLDAIPATQAISHYIPYLDGTEISGVTVNPGVNQYTYGGLTGNTSYSLTVEVVDLTGATDTSDALVVSTGYGDPSVPAPLWATDIVTSGFTLHWNASTAPSGCTINEYKIYKNGVHSWSVTGSPPATAAGLVGLVEGSTSLYNVSALDTCGGESALSVGLNVTQASTSPASITQTSNTSTGPGGIRTQVFEIGSTVNTGDLYTLMVYSHATTYTAVSGDTAADVVDGLVLAINNTTEVQWDSFNSAPPSGTNGFPPFATDAGDSISIDLNYQNQFAAWVS